MALEINKDDKEISYENGYENVDVKVGDYVVQTTFGTYRPSLNCEIQSYESGEEVCLDDEYLFETLIDIAESFVRSQFKEIKLNNYPNYTIIKHNESFTVYEDNNDYLNKDASPYELEFHHVLSEVSVYDLSEEAFESLEECRAALNKFLKN